MPARSITHIHCGWSLDSFLCIKFISWLSGLLSGFQEALHWQSWVCVSLSSRVCTVQTWAWCSRATLWALAMMLTLTPKAWWRPSMPSRCGEVRTWSHTTTRACPALTSQHSPSPTRKTNTKPMTSQVGQWNGSRTIGTESVWSVKRPCVLACEGQWVIEVWFKKPKYYYTAIFSIGECRFFFFQLNWDILWIVDTLSFALFFKTNFSQIRDS